jgi:hypothetical protein
VLTACTGACEQKRAGQSRPACRKKFSAPMDGSNWNRKVAAADLNISYKALLYKIKQHGFLQL